MSRNPTRDNFNVESVGFLHPVLITKKNPIDSGPIRNLGPDLYESGFTSWFQKHLEDHGTP